MRRNQRTRLSMDANGDVAEKTFVRNPETHVEGRDAMRHTRTAV
jgi:hypothetical protein